MAKDKITCKDCRSGVFCPSWGEYKCTKKHRVIHDPVMLDCSDYEKNTSGVELECRCEICESRRNPADDE